MAVKVSAFPMDELPGASVVSKHDIYQLLTKGPLTPEEMQWLQFLSVLAYKIEVGPMSSVTQSIH